MPARRAIHARTIAAILLEAGVVSHEQIEAALDRQRETGLRIGETLVEMGAATEEDIGWALARQLDLPFVDVQANAIDPELLHAFPEGLLWRLDAVPLLRTDESLSVALADPTDPEARAELERAAGRPIELGGATATAIRRLLGQVLGPRHDFRGRPSGAAGAGPHAVEWDRSGANLLLFHLTAARRAGATEIHCVPADGVLGVFHRVGGRMVRAGEEPFAVLHYLLARIESLGGPAIDDRVLHAEGRLVCPAGADEIPLEVSLLQSEEGVSVTMTLAPRAIAPPGLDALGLDPEDLALLRGALDGPAGLGLVGGPARSGGTTTLAALAHEAMLDGRRVLAFGDCARALPVGARVPASADEAAATWRRVAVAQCVDVVALDGVLAGGALGTTLDGAAAGRLVLARGDWMDGFALLERLAADPERREALAARLRFAVQQRRPRAAGAGRPVFEVLVATPALRDALRQGADAARLREVARREGFRSLAERLAARVSAGQLADDEAARLLA